MPRETLQAHAPTRWLPSPVPGHMPTSEGAPQLPNRPRLPHVPHFKHAGRITVLGLAGALALTAAEGFVRPRNTSDPTARAGEIPAEQMRYPWDSGNIPLELHFTQSEDIGSVLSGVNLAKDPEIIQVGENKFINYVLGEEYGEPTDPFGHVRITLLNDVMRGGVWQKLVDEKGNNILGADGKPILNPYGYIESITNQAPQLVNG